ncbi:4-hydroxy-3-methylbut-2-enyl diphosphate reductase [Desulfocapsa sp. AH-315-G09]|uniref:4-hydroxy-3-methylbut-2-enyl diphosphate reductase n=1 Tax=Desulfotalea psychrophila TaxID=84980 RepID=A0ABS3ASI6_9BACT|nr:4-hydroxy-3-methylbut-2-enyl diphosphate reductase [Desulfocapsa sp.]MBN4063917.1 4-hydroxy-3-methylbut-2-enyl diphosphate reductase [bacterium AH-315-I07]MBN4065047.1 4-hydroxy-3-methylbut-2-enyl diphosphate reductase [Desulfocapsa sp. AH-315-G09]MBN4068083.1 4-hydroxy-3-methylbut-2-enyl diphosphate reductase [Desulfotalea psychrophila]
MEKKGKKIILANPRGFCAGVERAISTVNLAVKRYGAPIFVLHEIVHNKHVVQELERIGVVFVNDLVEVPRNAICVFSAHGVSVATEMRARTLGLRTIDGTCPLVGSVHNMVETYHADGYDVLIIGHHKHPEVEGTAGRVSGNVHIVATEEEARSLQVQEPGRVAYVTQTTLSQDDIKGIREILVERFPGIKGLESNICYATLNRQRVMRELGKCCDTLLVVGSKNSSNSNRLREVGERAGMKGYLIDDEHDIEKRWLHGVSTLCITAGASAPERLVQGVIAFLRKQGFDQFEEIDGKEERVSFKPAILERKS